MLVAGVVALVPVALLAGGGVSSAAVPFVIASTALELTYFGLLATAYSRAGLTAVYPIARGSAPVIALVVSVAFLSARVGWVQALGVLAVAGGVMLVRGVGKRARVGLSLAVGTCIAGYTLVDDRGLDHADPLPYFAVVLALTAAGFCAVLVLRGRARDVRSALGWKPVVAGVGMATAYALTLEALARAEAAPVAALRETSVVMATAAAALWGNEHVSGARLAGAVAVVAGAAAIALG
jgi:drug/metabolite transporter (DMT)-like permease